MKVHLIATAFLVGTLTSPALANIIKIDYPGCGLSLTPLEWRTVPLVLSSETPDVRSVEFAIRNIPSSVLVVVSVNPPFTLVGDPMGVGAHIDVPAGTPTSYCELLQLDLMAPLAVQPIEPWILGHTQPSHSVNGCPSIAFGAAGAAECLTDWTPHHGPLVGSPPDHSTSVAVSTVLGWGLPRYTCPCVGPSYSEVYFGTEPNPPKMWSGLDLQPISLQLDPGTTYYWRVLMDVCGTVEGPLWTFTTEALVGAEQRHWGDMKRLYSSP